MKIVHMNNTYFLKTIYCIFWWYIALNYSKYFITIICVYVFRLMQSLLFYTISNIYDKNLTKGGVIASGNVLHDLNCGRLTNVLTRVNWIALKQFFITIWTVLFPIWYYIFIKIDFYSSQGFIFTRYFFIKYAYFLI